MDQDTINRYQPGGDIYASLLQSYGQSGANSVAQAALSGDETQINAALTQVKFGQPLNTSTADILLNQLATDPLAAPLADADTLTSNSLTDFLKSPAVLLVLGVAAFFALGGADVLRRKLAKL